MGRLRLKAHGSASTLKGKSAACPFVLVMDWDGEHQCRALSNASFVSDAGLIDFVVADDGSAPALWLHRAALQKRVDS